ncbi:c-type cytochrome [Pseudomonas protegens]|uniref:Cytochrome c2 n=1 Tax=Pseudomonas protegens TaxID=380021 RepID=A0A9Q6IG84_9PSED|nr:c-type cytochrome [Pseudomonas protegens]PYC37185.1 cytochrome c2 [Pseudomonas protegens]
MKYTPLLAAHVLLLTAPLALADGDAVLGKTLFSAQCGFCHSVENGKHLMGPSLQGVFGRASGQAQGFSYSSALQGAGLHWNDATLERWLSNPATLVPGNKMMFPGQADPQSRQHLIAYLKSLH